LSDDERKDQFSFGTAVNFYNESFDVSKVNATDPNDPFYTKITTVFL
jgi:hypothetical protein